MTLGFFENLTVVVTDGAACLSSRLNKGLRALDGFGGDESGANSL